MNFSSFKHSSGFRGVAVGLTASALVMSAAVLAQGADAGHRSQRIIGGTEVANGAHPFSVALLETGHGSARDRQFCGGSVASPDVILTAAHCVAGATSNELEVVAGRTVLSDAKQGQVRAVAPEGVVVHPRYAKNRAYDVAFIILAKPLKGISPVKLPTAGTDALIRPGQKATVVGWGNTDSNMGNFPDRLRQVQVPLLAHDECQVSYPKGYDSSVNICAGAEGKDSCQGDSGGPLFRTVRGRQDPIQIGVVSSGDGCAEQGAPGIYTSLSSAKLWKTLDESAKGREIKEWLRR